jgi:hypothetical protein
MQGSHRDKKSFPLTLGDEEGHEVMETDPRLLEFPPLDTCREPLFRRRLEEENEEEKICITAQQMNTSSIPSTSPCLQIFIAPGDNGFIRNLGTCVHTEIYSKIWGHVFTPKSRKMHRKPKTQESVREC